MNEDQSLSTTQVCDEQNRPLSITFSKFRLKVLLGPDAGKTVDCETPEVVVGVSPSCDMQLTDARVSRRHCSLSLTRKGCFVRDLDSTNGTFSGGIRIREAYVPPGAHLRIGETIIEIEPLGLPVEIKLSEKNTFGRLIGESIPMRQLFNTLEHVAKKDVTVLIQGETGVGKEVVAQSIHEESLRREGPFIPVDCASISPDLIESELFGHMKGSFTGATEDRTGVLEYADGGTLFLDEIGDMPVMQQSKLLRALETRTIRRIGATTDIPIDVRVVAATNRSLIDDVEAGTFRQDLYYRLAVVHATVPPLRERVEDIPLLARHFLARLATAKAPAPDLQPDALYALSCHSWPGNVRELRNVLETAVAMADSALLSAKDVLASPVMDSFTLPRVADLPGTIKLNDARDRIRDISLNLEKQYVLALLRENDFNVSKAARNAETHRQSLHRLMRRYGIMLKEIS